MGAGRLETGRFGVTTLTGWFSASSEARELALVGVALLGRLPEAAARTVTGPGSLFADEGTPTPMATAVRVATLSTARTPQTVRMHPLFYRNRTCATRVVGPSRNSSH